MKRKSVWAGRLVSLAFIAAGIFATRQSLASESGSPRWICYLPLFFVWTGFVTFVATFGFRRSSDIPGTPFHRISPFKHLLPFASFLAAWSIILFFCASATLVSFQKRGDIFPIAFLVPFIAATAFMLLQLVKMTLAASGPEVKLDGADHALVPGTETFVRYSYGNADLSEIESLTVYLRNPLHGRRDNPASKGGVVLQKKASPVELIGDGSFFLQLPERVHNDCRLEFVLRTKRGVPLLEEFRLDIAHNNP